MHKKTERKNYALASSNISDIPLNLDKKDPQGNPKSQATQFKQNSSIYQAFNQSRSRAEQSLSLHFSTARPFYGQEIQEYYAKRETEDRQHLQKKQQQDEFNKKRAKTRRSPNKKVMIYCYSNIVQFHNKLEKVILELKKRIFVTLSTTKKEERSHLLNINKKNTSFYSGQTNNTSREDALYRVSFGVKREDRYAFHQSVLQGFKIIEALIEYRSLLDKRKIFNLILQFGNDRKRFSLELSESLKVDINHNENYATDYYHSNEISLTKELPHQIQESLVYTIDHNSESTRKQLTQTTLQKYPTLKNYPSNHQIKERGSYRQVESQTSRKSSPMYKLKGFSNSNVSERCEIRQGLPLTLSQSVVKNNLIKTQNLEEYPLQHDFQNHQQQENKIDQHENVIQHNDVTVNLSMNDLHEQVNIDAEFKKIEVGNRFQNERVIENSAKYSDVSNYRMDNTVHKQEDQYKIVVHYHNNQPIPHDETVIRKPLLMPDKKNTPAKFQKYYFSSKEIQPSITTPKFSSHIQAENTIYVKNSQQKLVSQLQHERIRIFEDAKHDHKGQSIVAPLNISRLRGHFSPQAQSISPQSRFPITISSQKRLLSSRIQVENQFQPQVIFNHPHNQPIRIIEQPMSPHRSRSPDYQMQRTSTQPTIRQVLRPQQIQATSRFIYHANQPQQIHNPVIKEARQVMSRKIGTQNMIESPRFIRKESPHQRIIVSPQKSLNQTRQMHSKDKTLYFQREDYGYHQNIPQQKLQNAFVPKAFPSENHLMSIQRQYQLPPQIVHFKPQSPPIVQCRPNIILKSFPDTHNNKKRPQSSASSPKLFFNYNSKPESNIQKEIMVRSNQLTKNTSSIKRPKSMNTKLFVTLRKEL